MRSMRIWTVATLGGVALALGLAASPWRAPTAHAQQKDYKFLDYKLVRRALPTMRELSNKAAANGKKLHVMMDLLDTETDPKMLAKDRQDIGATLT